MHQKIDERIFLGKTPIFIGTWRLEVNNPPLLELAPPSSDGMCFPFNARQGFNEETIGIVSHAKGVHSHCLTFSVCFGLHLQPSLDANLPFSLGGLYATSF